MTVTVYNKRLKKETRIENVKNFKLLYNDIKDYYEFELNNGLYTAYNNSYIVSVEN